MFSTFCPFFSLSISFSFSLAFLLFRSPMRPMVGSSLHLLPMPCTKGAHVCSLHSRHRSHSPAKALATESRSHQPAPPAIASSRAVMLAGGGKLVEKEGGGGGWSSEQPPRCCLPATRPPPRHQARHQHIPTSVYLLTLFALLTLHNTNQYCCLSTFSICTLLFNVYSFTPITSSCTP